MSQRTEEEIMQSWQGDLYKPVVSICSITYNHEKYIAEALDSFLMQETNFPFEILIHDDASTDSTAEIIRSYENKYPSLVKPIYQTENQYSKGIKINSTFNLPRAQGEYIALCEGDDFWTDKKKLQFQIEKMREDSKCQLSFHSTSVVNTLTKTDTLICRHAEHDKIFNIKEIIKGNGGFCPTASLIIKKEVFDNIPSFVGNAPVGDYFIQIFGSMNGGALYIDKSMSAYRIHSGGVWTSMGSNFSSRKKFSFEMLHSLEEMDRFFNFQYNKEIAFIKSQVFSDILENKNFSIRDRVNLYQRCKDNIIGEQQTKWLDDLVKDYEQQKETIQFLKGELKQINSKTHTIQNAIKKLIGTPMIKQPIKKYNAYMDFISLYESLNPSIIEDDNHILFTVKPKMKNVQVAFYLLKDNERIDTKWYSEDLSYKLDKKKYGKGKYRIHYFVIDKNEEDPGKAKKQEIAYSEYVEIT